MTYINVGPTPDDVGYEYDQALELSMLAVGIHSAEPPIQFAVAGDVYVCLECNAEMDELEATEHNCRVAS